MEGEQSNKKRKLSASNDAHPLRATCVRNILMTRRRGRPSTVSVAIPGSIINLPTAAQRSAAVARIAHSLAAAGVDEVIVYEDGSMKPRAPPPPGTTANEHSRNSNTDLCPFLATQLEFLSCPPFMRSRQFPGYEPPALNDDDARAAAQQASSMPHHRGPKDPCLPYAEGIVVPAPPGSSEAHDDDCQVSGNYEVGAGDYESDVECFLCGCLKRTFVDVGFERPVRVDGVAVAPGWRLMMRFHGPEPWTSPQLVLAAAPRAEDGYYFGYTVRRAAGLAGVFAGGTVAYDLAVGVSRRRGALVEDVIVHYQCVQRMQREQQRQQSGNDSPNGGEGSELGSLNSGCGCDSCEYSSGEQYYNNRPSSSKPLRSSSSSPPPPPPPPPFQRLLVVFGGRSSVEDSVLDDPRFSDVGISPENMHRQFNYFVIDPTNPDNWDMTTDESLSIMLVGLSELWVSL